MRIQGLHLLRYGRFTDMHLPLPRSESDIHIVFGPNEAGKSTALSAIEGLLFGIPGKLALQFLARLWKHEGRGNIGERREDTRVSAPQGKQGYVTDRARGADRGRHRRACSVLAGADQTFFTRMFSLDHERLRRGGREILEAQDEVGQMLFSAGAGLSGLRERLKTSSKRPTAYGLHAKLHTGSITKLWTA